ncbi:cobalamin-dependent protein [Candidatus Dependentiae bacterium]|nr:cobalamin-dependent protein [Candidatus Dependentiae bacterium]
MENKNILFIMPSSNKSYKDVAVKSAAFHLPSLALAILGAVCKENGYIPKILDLTFYEDDNEILSKTIKEFNPKHIGLTCTSATYFHALEIAKICKQINPDIPVVIGGPHASASVENTLQNDCFDYVFIGESEISFVKYLNGESREKIEGLAFKNKDGSIHRLDHSSYISNMDKIPFPDYTLYDMSLYSLSKLHTPDNPVIFLETSRGCPFKCKICNKIVHGYKFRPKSAERVLDEIEHHIKTIGIKSFFIADDGFTTDMKRSEDICDGILARKIKISWYCSNGIRADRINQTLMHKMKKAGCYRVSFGIESGNQKVLDNTGKNTTLEKIETGIRMTKKAGIEAFGFFIVGFADDTEKTMDETIKFANKLPLDYVKVSIAMPFPGTILYDEYNAQNLIFPPGDFRMYNFHLSPRSVYKHPSLDWEIVEKYYRKFYRSFYFNPAFILRRFIGSIKTGSFFNIAKVAVSIAFSQRKK